MVLVERLTPETLLSAPRRSPAVPNRTGTLALHSVSTHVWGDKTTTDVRVMDLETTESWTVTSQEKVHDPNWIPGSTEDEILYLKSGEKGKTEIYVARGGEKGSGKAPVVIAEIDAPLADLKLKELEDGSVAFVVSCLVGEHGGLYNEVKEKEKKKSTGVAYNTVNVRSWDSPFKQQRYSLWYTTIVRTEKGHNEGAAWKLSGELQNLVNTDTIEAPFGKYDIMNPLDFYDVSRKGIAFLGRDLVKERNPDLCLASYPYFVPVDSYTQPPTHKPKPIAIKTTADEAWIASGIQFSPDSENIAFMLGKVSSSYESRIQMTSVSSLDAFDVISLVNNIDLESIMDPPEAFRFAGSSDRLLLVNQSVGRHAVSLLRLADGEKPKVVFKEGTLAALSPLGEGNFDRLLVSTHSAIDSSLWQVIDISGVHMERDQVEGGGGVVGGVKKTVISSATKHGVKYGLSQDQVQEIWFSGADDICVQSFIYYPSDFDEEKKYPWVFIPHGGPVASQMDAWSTRWNMLTWAEQGYVVIAPNITGSQGFGVEFVKRIKGQYGGKPFQDCLRLIEHLETLPYLDLDKAVFAGASYGGYMGSWFFCHDVIKKFCAAIWHDGVFAIPTTLLQADYLIDSGEFDHKPNLWSNQAELERWNPATQSRLAKWKRAPPTLVIHSDKDYRCPIVEGLAAFRTLQGLGVPSRFLTFSDEGHWVLNPENSLVWHTEVFEWVRRCVNGELKRGDKKW